MILLDVIVHCVLLCTYLWAMRAHVGTVIILNVLGYDFTHFFETACRHLTVTTRRQFFQR